MHQSIQTRYDKEHQSIKCRSKLLELVTIKNAGSGEACACRQSLRPIINDLFAEYNPIKTIKTSTIGTINMLGLAKRVRARILFTSTSEVYGDPKEHPQKETYWGHVNPIGVHLFSCVCLRARMFLTFTCGVLMETRRRPRAENRMELHHPYQRARV